MVDKTEDCCDEFKDTIPYNYNNTYKTFICPTCGQKWFMNFDEYYNKETGDCGNMFWWEEIT